MSFTSKYLLAAVAAAALLPGGATRAEENTRRELAQLAGALHKELGELGGTSVALRGYRGKDGREAPASSGYVELLKEELARLGIKVDQKAPFEVRGTVEPGRDAQTDRKCVVMKTELALDGFEWPIAAWQSRIFGEEAQAVTFGFTMAPVPGRDGRKPDGGPAVAPRAPVLDGSRVCTDPGKQLGIEFCVVNPGGTRTPRTPAARSCGAWVSVQEGEVWVLRLTNRSADEMAVRVSIDGVPLAQHHELTDAQGKPLPRELPVLVAAGGEVVVRGWPITAQRSDAFQLKAYPDGAVAVPPEVGTVTAAFVTSWPRGTKPPNGEVARGGGTKGAVGTGRGLQQADRIELVEREFGSLRGTVTLRYGKDN